MIKTKRYLSCRITKLIPKWLRNRPQTTKKQFFYYFIFVLIFSILNDKIGSKSFLKSFLELTFLFISSYIQYSRSQGPFAVSGPR